MRTKHASIIGLLTIILIAGAAAVEEARAEIRVRATLNTPQVRLHVSNAPSGPQRYMVRDRGSYHYRNRHQVSRRDRLVAKRISRYCGIPRRELIDLRWYGYTWREIGRWYELPRPLIRAANGDDRKWRRWLKHHRVRGHRGREMARRDRRHLGYDD